MASSDVTVSLPGPSGAAAGEAPLAAGVTLGRFVIEETLGAGGMGVVYLAEDPLLERKVALKLLRTGGSRPAQARLLREAQALAKLAHPNVIAVYEVGTIGGRVFIAMEYVRGRTLAAPAAGTGWRDVVGLYLQAGRGLAAAHAAGLVHRDFKPSNVLVGDADGRVRVVDFGLARSADDTTGVAGGDPERAAAVMATLTQDGAVLGTPAYMAPEQRRGQTADALSDEYSFACALHEALWGERPAAGAARPPAGAAPGWVWRVLQRALADDPAARFPSMDVLLAALAADPARTRRRWTIVAALIGLPVVAGASVLALRPDPARPCHAVADRLVGLWDPPRKQAIADAFRATKVPYAEAAWGGVERAVDGFTADWVARRTEACQATVVRHEQSQAALDLRAACFDRRLDDLDALLRLFAAPDPPLVARAAGTLAGLAPPASCDDVGALSDLVPPPRDPALRDRVAAVDKQISALKALYTAGRYKAGLAQAPAVVEAATALDDAPALAEALFEEGALRLRTGDAKGAEAALTTAIEASERAHDDSTRGVAWVALAETVGVTEGRHGEAHRYLSFARAALARRGDDRDQAAADEIEGLLYYNEHDNDQAIALYKRALAGRERAGDEPRVAGLLNNLANAESAAGRVDDALADNARSLALVEKIFGPDHPHVAMLENNLGVANYRQGRLDEAGAHFARALALEERLLGRDNPSLADPVNNLGEVYADQGRFAEALPLHQRAQELWEKGSGPDGPLVANALIGEGRALIGLGRAGEARAPLERALALREHVEKPVPSEVARAKYVLAQALWAGAGASDRGRALALATSARDLYQASAGNDKELADVNAWLAAGASARR